MKLKFWIDLLHWGSWTTYIPVIGGTICLLIGVLEFSWKPCVIGAAAIAFGVLRVWANTRLRQELRDKR
jgi:hypothetical protein